MIATILFSTGIETIIDVNGKCEKIVYTLRISKGKWKGKGKGTENCLP